MELRFTVQAKIQKPVAEVFDAVRNPDKLSKYFATGGASAPIEEGKMVTWRWADHPDVVGEVHVKKVVPNQLIVFEWAASEGGYNTRTEMKFEPIGDRQTLVSITESGWKDTEKARNASYGNCHGWTQMSASLKAWLEYGINLRKGYY
jgi:uncharacterized protein YndB with AHSA1/START domain